MADRPAPTDRACVIVFSDLDGTLLDHDGYDWRPAAPALDMLRARAIALVLASSKTAAEIAPLRAAIGFAHCPAIVENGAGLLAPGDDGSATDDTQYRRLRAILAQAPADLRGLFTGFGDMDANAIAAATGLDRRSAALAARRRFSEPGLWSGGEDGRARFIAWLADRGVAARAGGRFLTLSFGGSKAGRMDEVAATLCRDAPAFTIALGDAPNDIEMLEHADLGIIVANPHGVPIPKLSGEDDGRVSRTAQIGPAGWNAALVSILCPRRGTRSP
ncbi:MULTISPECIES: HAD hydrolase family protein [unclassified Roseitalea]|uniref:HAD-IIB family hydrolase n=1 Tax=unclassified Roseitalea TaxID=2639107 RepID=UPI00273F1C5D|nr:MULTISPECIES: HAD hydrolase family protein [unclassified Roseitalea]